jgi:hypothetical protein
MWIVEDMGHLKAEDEMKTFLAPQLDPEIKGEGSDISLILEEHAVHEKFQDFLYIQI